VVYRKGELSKGAIDRGWPHQVGILSLRRSMRSSSLPGLAVSIWPLRLGRRGLSAARDLEAPGPIKTAETARCPVNGAAGLRHPMLRTQWSSTSDAGAVLPLSG